ncbi:MAG TPA: HEPN domain-containing protein [Candidatus Ozemobacteraceae bacterium]|nr:HEPN domain-containing protein [Candidatus Ozemobacteraceae bacterium]
MTDRETLLAYRWQQAAETLADARSMLRAGVSPRSIINRAYYAAFYGVLALFLSERVTVKSGKHVGIIGAFNEVFIRTGIIPKEYSRTLQRLFERRQRGDYMELEQLTEDDAAQQVALSESFVAMVRNKLGIS